MFHLYKSNDLGQLANKYFDVNKNITRPLLAPQPLIVSNMTIGRWLIHEITKKQGVCANTERLLPGAYLWRLICQMNTTLPTRYDLNKEILVLRILALFDDSVFVKDYPRLSNYLSKCSSSDKVELCKKIAKVFDHYQLYRSDWLDQWKAGKYLDLGEDEGWQQALWLKLLASSKYSYRNALEEKLIHILNTQPETLDLPESLCLFGISSLATGFINVLKALANHCNIHLFTFTYGVDSSVLSHWKISEIGFFKQLDQKAEEFIKQQPIKNQLQFFQNNLIDGITAESNTNFINTFQSKQVNDNSIMTVSCYTAMREVEALSDHILNLLDINRGIEAGDILVAIPNLDEYVPYIRAVFDCDRGNDRTMKIPYSICDSLAASESPLINGFTELLTLPKWRFTLEQVMMLFRNHLVHKKFNIDDSQIDLIEHWLEEAAVRWAIDTKHWQELGLHENNTSPCLNTWRSGLDRLLLGFALPRDLSSILENLDNSSPLYHDVLPVDNIEGAGRELLSNFSHFCEQLFSWKKILNESFTLQQWQLTLQKLIDDFFIKDQSEEQNNLQLLQLFDQLATDAEQINYQQALDVEAISVLIKEGVSASSRGSGLSGSVNFASMNTLASIPFKHICILGMNYDAWPNKQREPGFDLIQQKRRLGDRIRSDDDRYLTLQLILSAKESLYFSYTGHNIHNGAEIPPSVLLSEILDANERLGCKIKTVQHPMHIYSSNNFIKKNPLQSHNHQWLETAKHIGLGCKNFPVLCDSPLQKNKEGLTSEDVLVEDALDDIIEEIVHIDFDDVCRFFQNPQSYFLRNSLGVFIADDTKEWSNNEPFDLGNFVDKQVRQIALDIKINSSNGNHGSSYQMSRASGILPHGQYGEILQKSEQEKVDDFYEYLDEEFLSQVLPPHGINLELTLNDKNNDINKAKKIKLVGALRNLRPEGLLSYQVSDLYLYQKIQLWLNHLLLCSLRPEGITCETRLHYLNNKQLEFNQPDNPEELLSQWISAYLQGLQQPLPFFDKTSWAYADTSFKGQKKLEKYKPKEGQDNNVEQETRHKLTEKIEELKNKSLGSARSKWHDEYRQLGQKLKPANHYIYRGHEPFENDFGNLAINLLIPLMKHEVK